MQKSIAGPGLGACDLIIVLMKLNDDLRAAATARGARVADLIWAERLIFYTALPAYYWYSMALIEYLVLKWVKIW